MISSKTLSVIAVAFVGLILCVSAQAQRTAKAIPTGVNGFAIAVTVTDGGAGYTNAPLVTISGGGSGA
jgi:galactitol-specific phosphotransferase system IIC component